MSTLTTVLYALVGLGTWGALWTYFWIRPLAIPVHWRDSGDTSFMFFLTLPLMVAAWWIVGTFFVMRAVNQRVDRAYGGRIAQAVQEEKQLKALKAADDYEKQLMLAEAQVEMLRALQPEVGDVRQLGAYHG